MKKESMLDLVRGDIHQVFTNIDLDAFKRWFKTLKKITNANGSLDGIESFKDATAGFEVIVLDKDFVRVLLMETIPKEEQAVSYRGARSVNLLHEDLGRIIKSYK